MHGGSCMIDFHTICAANNSSLVAMVCFATRGNYYRHSLYENQLYTDTLAAMHESVKLNSTKYNSTCTNLARHYFSQQVYAYLGKKYFIDLTYELSNDTLGLDSNIPCNTKMNINYDNCLYSQVHARLYDKFGCTVPFLPKNESLKICVYNQNTSKYINNYFEMLLSSGTGSLCPSPCATMQVNQ